jgi:ankyrin repeat protein
MKEYTIKVHEISKDGLPDMDYYMDDDALIGRVAFIHNGAIVTGWPVDGEEAWETDKVVGKRGLFYHVTHWVEFPIPIWDMEGEDDDFATKYSTLKYRRMQDILDEFDRLMHQEDIEGIKRLLTGVPLDYYGTFLFEACYSRKGKVVQFLLEAGANPDGSLHMVAFSGYSEIAVMLLEAGANPNALGEHKSTPLHACLTSKYKTIEELKETIEVLLKYGASINAQDDVGRTPLHRAVTQNQPQPEIVELLLRRGAKTDVKDKYGETPRQTAGILWSELTAYLKEVKW